ncbi:MAG: hypothetical protein IPN11_03235 [Opitutaceae bacterium]|nr:hypothetical protein [Opitutaceae bacterium]
MHLPVQPYDALRHVQLTERAAADGAAQARQHLPVLVGLAASQLPDMPRPLSLLPPNLRAHHHFRRRQPWWIATAALLVIAWVPPLWHFRAQARATRLEMARVEAELVPLRRLESRMAEFTARREKLQQEIGVLHQWLESRSSWPGFLADLQHHLASAEDAWLERMHWGKQSRAQRIRRATRLGRCGWRSAGDCWTGGRRWRRSEVKSFNGCRLCSTASGPRPLSRTSRTSASTAANPESCASIAPSWRRRGMRFNPP